MTVAFCLGSRALWAEPMPLPFLDTCVAPQADAVVMVQVPYQDYHAQRHLVTIPVPRAQVQMVKQGFADLMSGHFRIARLMSFADLPAGGLRQAFENNISTVAVCEDWGGTARYFIFLNPAQNPNMETTLPCGPEGCHVSIVPATSTLALNRYVPMQGMMTTMLSTWLSEKDHWTYEHEPAQNLLLWSVFTVPLAS